MRRRQVVLLKSITASNYAIIKKFMLWKVRMISANVLTRRKRNMKKITLGLLIAAAIFILGLIIVFYVFEQETVSVGRYSVLYYKNRSDIDTASFPQDLESLKELPGLIRITWREPIGSDIYQEYCYLPGKGVEQTRIIRTKRPQ